MNTDIYTIDKTPSTELEKYQALRIEALEKDREKSRQLLKELQEAMENYAKCLDITEAEILTK